MLATDVNFAFSCVPIVPTTLTIAIEMTDAMSAYSIDVAADWSFRNLVNRITPAPGITEISRLAANTMLPTGLAFQQ
jgi:hypothetical protein